MNGMHTSHRQRRRQSTKRNLALLLAFALAAAVLSLPSAVDAQDHPICSSSAADPDGDGWGWENDQTCIVDNSGGTDSGSRNTGSPNTSLPKAVVSMGDSYISGESGHLIGNNSAERRSNAYLGGTNGTNGNFCRRSDVAPIRSAGISGVRAINIACSGATTFDIIGNGGSDRSGRYGEGLQIDQLRDLTETNDIEMVVVSIGGNDLGFVEFTTSCVVGYASGSNCSSPGGEADRYTQRLTSVMAPRVQTTLNQIKQVLANAGQSDARVVLQSYPSAVPASTSYASVQRLNHGCAFTETDMRYIKTEFVPALDATLETVANNTGVDFLSLSNAFDGKEVCSPEVTGRDNTADHSELEWVTGIRIANSTATQDSIHPNALGQRALGTCLRLMWSSNSSYNKCYNNGNGPWDMRLGSRSTGGQNGGGQNGGGANTDVPLCQNESSDPDGDGWGFENGRSCYAEISAEDVDCEDVSGMEARICELLLDQINEDLEVGQLSVDEGGLLFTYEDPTDSRINSASCSNRASITHQKATVRIGSDTRLNVRGDAITEPFAVGLAVPFEIDARVDAKSKLGIRILFGCTTIGSDSYYAVAHASGTAELIVAFDLDPSFTTNLNGDLVLTIQPVARIATDLNNPNLDFRIRGTNPIAQFYAFTASLTRTLSDSTVALLSGDSVGDAIGARELDLGVPVVLTGGEVLTSSVIWDLIRNYAERETQRAAQGIGVDLEVDLNQQLTDSLKLVDGQRSYVITGDFASLIRNGATLDDLLRTGS